MVPVGVVCMQWGFVTAWSLGNGCVLSSAQLCNVSALERRHTNHTELQALCAAMRQSIGQDTLGGDYKCVTGTLSIDSIRFDSPTKSFHSQH
jgi:hypothetical protein